MMLDRTPGSADPGTMIRRFLIAVGLLVAVVVGAFAAVIAFNAPAAPPVLAAGNSIPGIAQWNFSELPEQQAIKARDGAPLNYRLYPGRADRAVVLVHGSTGSGGEMLKLAQALQAAGATVYAISLRGHGGSGNTNGDVSYIGQLDDDLADLVKGLGLDKPGMRRTLAGFSSGGGFVLRIAGGRHAALFNDYLAVSPFISEDAPTNKPNSGGWAGVAVPRIVALSILEGFRLSWFQGLPVIHFATDAKASDTARRPTPSGWRRACSSAETGVATWRASRRRPRSWSAPMTSSSLPTSSSRCCRRSIRASA
jgi:pimeloyl-ACP methyl ester carboxylesterase